MVRYFMRSPTSLESKMNPFGIQNFSFGTENKPSLGGIEPVENGQSQGFFPRGNLSHSNDCATYRHSEDMVAVIPSSDIKLENANTDTVPVGNQAEKCEKCSILQKKLNISRGWNRFFKEKLLNIDKVLHILNEYENEKTKNLELQLAYDQRSREWSHQQEQLINLLHEIQPLREKLKAAEEVATEERKARIKHQYMEESLKITIEQLQAKVSQINSLANPIFVENLSKKLTAARSDNKKIRRELEYSKVEVEDLRSHVSNRHNQIEKLSKKFYWALSLADKFGVELLKKKEKDAELSEKWDTLQSEIDHARESLQTQYDTFKALHQKKFKGKFLELLCLSSFDDWILDFDNEKMAQIIKAENAEEAKGVTLENGGLQSDIENDANKLEELLVNNSPQKTKKVTNKSTKKTQAVDRKAVIKKTERGEQKTSLLFDSDASIAKSTNRSVKQRTESLGETSDGFKSPPKSAKCNGIKSPPISVNGDGFKSPSISVKGEGSKSPPKSVKADEYKQSSNSSKGGGVKISPKMVKGKRKLVRKSRSQDSSQSCGAEDKDSNSSLTSLNENRAMFKKMLNKSLESPVKKQKTLSSSISPQSPSPRTTVSTEFILPQTMPTRRSKRIMSKMLSSSSSSDTESDREANGIESRTIANKNYKIESYADKIAKLTSQSERKRESFSEDSDEVTRKEDKSKINNIMKEMTSVSLRNFTPYSEDTDSSVDFDSCFKRKPTRRSIKQKGMSETGESTMLETDKNKEDLENMKVIANTKQESTTNMKQETKIEKTKKKTEENNDNEENESKNKYDTDMLKGNRKTGLLHMSKVATRSSANLLSLSNVSIKCKKVRVRKPKLKTEMETNKTTTEEEEPDDAVIISKRRIKRKYHISSNSSDSSPERVSSPAFQMPSSPTCPPPNDKAGSPVPPTYEFSSQLENRVSPHRSHTPSAEAHVAQSPKEYNNFSKIFTHSPDATKFEKVPPSDVSRSVLASSESPSLQPSKEEMNTLSNINGEVSLDSLPIETCKENLIDTSCYYSLLRSDLSISSSNTDTEENDDTLYSRMIPKKEYCCIEERLNGSPNKACENEESTMVYKNEIILAPTTSMSNNLVKFKKPLTPLQHLQSCKIPTKDESESSDKAESDCSSPSPVTTSNALSLGKDGSEIGKEPEQNVLNGTVWSKDIKPVIFPKEPPKHPADYEVKMNKLFADKELGSSPTYLKPLRQRTISSSSANSFTLSTSSCGEDVDNEEGIANDTIKPQSQPDSSDEENALIIGTSDLSDDGDLEEPPVLEISEVLLTPEVKCEKRFSPDFKQCQVKEQVQTQPHLQHTASLNRQLPSVNTQNAFKPQVFVNINKKPEVNGVSSEKLIWLPSFYKERNNDSTVQDMPDVLTGIFEDPPFVEDQREAPKEPALVVEEIRHPCSYVRDFVFSQGELAMLAKEEIHLDELQELFQDIIGCHFRRQEWSHFLTKICTCVDEAPGPNRYSKFQPLIRVLVIMVLRSSPYEIRDANFSVPPTIYKLFQIVRILEIHQSLSRFTLDSLVSVAAHRLILYKCLRPNSLASLTTWVMASCYAQYNALKRPLDEECIHWCRCFFTDLLFHHKGVVHEAILAAVNTSKKVFIRMVCYREATALEQMVHWIAVHGFWIGPKMTRTKLLETLKAKIGVHKQPPEQPKELLKSILSVLIRSDPDPDLLVTSKCGFLLLLKWVSPVWITRAFFSLLKTVYYEEIQTNKLSLEALKELIGKSVKAAKWPQDEEEQFMKRLTKFPIVK